MLSNFFPCFHSNFSLQFIDLSFDVGVQPDGCSGDPLVCTQVTFALCASAAADAPTGGHQYTNDVLMQVGTQQNDQFYPLAQVTLPLKFQVPSSE